MAFSVEATGAATYQWKRNNTALAGAMSATFTLTSATIADAGNYTVDVINAAGTTTSAAAALTVSAAGDPGRIVNFAIRSTVGTGAQTLIVGLALSGATDPGSQTRLVRGAGPTLATFGVTGVLADPKLALYRGPEKIAESDNWQTSANLVNTFARVGAFDFNVRSKDAVLYLTLAPGAYTAQVSGASTTIGVALIEVCVLP